MANELQKLILTSPLLAQFEEVEHGFTQKDLGADTRSLSNLFGISPDVFTTLKQIHSNKVVIYDDSKRGSQEEVEGDALICAQKGVFIGVRTADCVPLLGYAPDQKIVVAIHAGWRGMIAGIIESTLENLESLYRIRKDELNIVIGPCISQDAFEVGPEVVAEFEKKFTDNPPIRPGTGDRSHIDLKKTAYRILMENGVSPQNIDVLVDCTYTHNDKWYSFRRGDKDGRSLAFIGMK